MKNKTTITIGEKYGPAMEITDQAEADKYFEWCVEYHLQAAQEQGKPITRERAIAIEKSNLGYYAGYYSTETRERVEQLFRCEHPVFGAISTKGAPTPQEAFEAGVRVAKKWTL